MQTFTLTAVNKKALIPATIIAILALLVIPFLLFDTIEILRFISKGFGMFAVVMVVLVAGLALKSIFSQKITVQLAPDNLIILKKDGSSSTVSPQSISLIKVAEKGLSQKIDFYTSDSKPFLTINGNSKKSDSDKLLNALQQQLTLVKSAEKNSASAGTVYEYINKNDVQSGVVQKVQQSVGASKKRTSKIAFAAVAVIFLALLIPFFINSKAFYDTKGDKVFFGKKEMTGVNPQEFTTISYNIAKDCTHIYFRGEPVDFVDRKSFHELGNNTFYADKNGIYYETNHLFTKNKLLPMEGNYDKKTFKQLGSANFYVDKDHLFDVDPFKNPPLKTVDVPGLDLSTLEGLEFCWLADKNRVYFSNLGKIIPAKEIDRASFKVLSYQVAKDKNHVYYITKDLKSEDKAATEEFNYAILTGADAASFEMIDNDTYRDKNQDWNIMKEGEKVYTR